MFFHLMILDIKIEVEVIIAIKTLQLQDTFPGEDIIPIEEMILDQGVVIIPLKN